MPKFEKALQLLQEGQTLNDTSDIYERETQQEEAVNQAFTYILSDRI